MSNAVAQACTLTTALLLGVTLAATAQAAAPAPAPPAKPAAESGTDLTELPIEALMDLQVEVTSVFKRAVPLQEAPAAVFVLSGDAIRRSGVRTIADALRMVPGLLVVRITAQSYVVTARGFPGEKLEVFIDGRSVYTPLTSVVFWDVLDTYLPDIERIEVARGPGSILTLWGANAMNGVVNIVTKSAARTDGTQISGGGGNEEKSFGAVRSGGRVGDSAHARLYAQHRNRDSTLCGANTAACMRGQEAPDAQHQTTVGFRSDWDYAAARSLSASGDLYREEAGTVSAASSAQSVQKATEQGGSNLTLHWNADLEQDGKLAVIAYYAHYRRELPELFLESRDTYDLELEHRLPLSERNLFTWALGARSTHSETGGPPLLAIFDPASRTLNTYAASLQDQVRLFNGFELTLGSKFEHNDFTGFEVQPGIRLGWKLSDDAYTWASVARAVRTPNQLEDGLLIYCTAFQASLGFCSPAGSTVPRGNRDLKSEKLIAYEWGLRLSPDPGLTGDLAAFFNDYSELRSNESSPAPFGKFGNSLSARTWGGELTLGWQPAEWLGVRAFYNLLKMNVRREAGSTDARSEYALENGSPRQSGGLRLSLQPRGNVSIDSFVRYVDPLPATATPAYTELNTRLAWKPWPALELALVGENLLDPHHPESGSVPSARQPQQRAANELQRSLFAEFRWSWQ